jgi:predicted dehydrogenase
MPKVLIIGYSSLVKRRIISTLIRNKISYDIASRSKKQKDTNAENWYHGYNNGINNSNADIAYISLPNSLHYYWAIKSLNKNFHTLIDKPATLNLKQLDKLIYTSKKKKKVLSESVFFNYHLQIQSTLDKIKKNKVKRVNANFLIPKPNIKSILLSNKLKGGVIMDMGPYIAAISRLFFKSAPKKIIKNIVFKNKISSKIEIIFIYKDSFFIGKFSHDDQYKNFIEIYLSNKTIKLSRVFSPPAQENLKVLELNEKKNKSKIFKDDAFEKYIKDVFKKIKEKKYNYYHNQMIFDVKIRELLQN